MARDRSKLVIWSVFNIQHCKSHQHYNAILKCIRAINVVGYWQFTTVGISSGRNNSATTNKSPQNDIYHARIMVINDFLYDAFVSRFRIFVFVSILCIVSVYVCDISLMVNQAGYAFCS